MFRRNSEFYDQFSILLIQTLYVRWWHATWENIRKMLIIKRKKNTKPLFWIICHIFVARTITDMNAWVNLLSAAHTHNQIIDVLFISIDSTYRHLRSICFLIGIFFCQYFINANTHLTKKLLQHIFQYFDLYVLPFGRLYTAQALLIGVYLCSKCLRVLTYVLFLCVFCTIRTVCTTGLQNINTIPNVIAIMMKWNDIGSAIVICERERRHTHNEKCVAYLLMWKSYMMPIFFHMYMKRCCRS